MKYLMTTTVIVLVAILAVSCKSKSTLVDTDDDLVTVVTKSGLKPSVLVKRTPYIVVSEKLVDKAASKWAVKFDTGKKPIQDVINYLINLDQVVSVNDIQKDVTPPVGTKSKIETKKM